MVKAALNKIKGEDEQWCGGSFLWDTQACNINLSAKEEATNVKKHTTNLLEYLKCSLVLKIKWIVDTTSKEVCLILVVNQDTLGCFKSIQLLPLIIKDYLKRYEVNGPLRLKKSLRGFLLRQED